jgi:hypothetical protein
MSIFFYDLQQVYGSKVTSSIKKERVWPTIQMYTSCSFKCVSASSDNLQKKKERREEKSLHHNVQYIKKSRL